MTKYIVIDESEDSIFCLGVFKDYYTALGHVMDAIFDFKESYKEKGDEFKIGELEDLECESGVGITIEYKAASWSKSSTNDYYILTCEGGEL